MDRISKLTLTKVEKFSLPNVHLVVIGNKSDSQDSREVELKEAQEYCAAKGIKHFEASAKNGEHVT